MSDSTVTPAQGVPRKRSRLCMVAEDQGMTVDEMLSKASTDSVAPGICMQCDAIFDSCEPDAQDYWCDNCDAGTVKSVLIIAGLI